MLTFQRHVGNTAEAIHITDPKQIEGITLSHFPLFFVSASVINTGTVIPLNFDHASPEH